VQFFVPNEEARLPFTVSSHIPSLGEVTPKVLGVWDPLKPVIVCGRLSILYKVGIHVLLGRHPVLEVNYLPRVLILVIPLLLNGLIGSGRCLFDAFKVFFVILTFISPTGRPFLKSELNPAVQCTLTQLLVYAQFWG
jgi:hypothetical protein